MHLTLPLLEERAVPIPPPPGWEGENLKLPTWKTTWEGHVGQLSLTAPLCPGLESCQGPPSSPHTASGAEHHCSAETGRRHKTLPCPSHLGGWDWRWQNVSLWCNCLKIKLFSFLLRAAGTNSGEAALDLLLEWARGRQSHCQEEPQAPGLEGASSSP